MKITSKMQCIMCLEKWCLCFMILTDFDLQKQGQDSVTEALFRFWRKIKIEKRYDSITFRFWESNSDWFSITFRFWERFSATFFYDLSLWGIEQWLSFFAVGIGVPWNFRSPWGSSRTVLDVQKSKYIIRFVKFESFPINFTIVFQCVQLIWKTLLNAHAKSTQQVAQDTNLLKR